MLEADLCCDVDDVADVCIDFLCLVDLPIPDLVDEDTGQVLLLCPVWLQLLHFMMVTYKYKNKQVSIYTSKYHAQYWKVHYSLNS